MPPRWPCCALCRCANTHYADSCMVVYLGTHSNDSGFLVWHSSVQQNLFVDAHRACSKMHLMKSMQPVRDDL